MKAGKARLEAFSDGVIAIVITVMVIELHIPDALARGFDQQALSAFAPALAAYGISFLVVGIMWINHHHLLDTIQVADRQILWRNLLLLFTMSLVPLATVFLGEHPQSSNAAAIYGFLMLACAGAFTLLQRSVANASDGGAHKVLAPKYLVGLSLYAASAILAFVSPLITWAILVANAALFFVPDWWTLFPSSRSVANSSTR